MGAASCEEQAGAATKHSFLRKTLKVGSCRGLVINHSSHETLFSADDVPPARRARRKEVLEWQASGILPVGVSKPWQMSVSVPIKHTRTRALAEGGPSCLYRHNYRAEVLPQALSAHTSKSSKFNLSVTSSQMSLSKGTAPLDSTAPSRPYSILEMPVHPALEGKAPWNVCATLTPKEKREHYDALMKKCAVGSATVSSRAATCAAYVTPEQRTQRAIEQVRELKKSGQWRVTSAGALSSEDAAEMAAISSTQKRRRQGLVRIHTHSGVWHYSAAEGRHMWSDTGSFERDSPGDVVRVFDPHAMNLASPCTR
jgi:hypothetical protein